MLKKFACAIEINVPHEKRSDMVTFFKEFAVQKGRIVRMFNLMCAAAALSVRTYLFAGQRCEFCLMVL